jgi:hypothetical protein
LKQKWYRQGKWLLLGLILLIPITLVWILMFRPLPSGASLARSRRLPATKGTVDYGGSAMGYAWADATTIRQIDSVSGNSLDVKDIDVATGAVRKRASYPKGKETGYIAEQLIHLSPDRKWVLYTGFTTDTMMSLTGRPVSYQLPIDKPPVLNKSITILQRTAWVPDGLHWIELSEDPARKGVILVHTVDGKTLKRVPIPGAAQWRTLLGVTARSTALVEVDTAKSGQRPHVKFLEVDITTGQTVENTALGQVASLADSEIMTPALSPVGDRLVWATRHQSDILTSLARLIRHKPQTARYEISTCRLDGSQVHTVDNVECSGNQTVEMMAWIPDSKQISFAFRNTLYTAPAD